MTSQSPKTSPSAPPLDPASEAPRVPAKHLPLAPPPLEGDELERELVPARMINEVLYCERLMYLEWVQGEWADNRYTAEGKAVHRRVDQKGGRRLRAPAADGGAQPSDESTGSAGIGATAATANATFQEDRPYSARSVWLSSDRLGITGKMDVVEVDGNHVVPVEYKRGKEPQGGPYLPERAQVAAQVLLLREHGYQCEGGEIYYAEERRRVPVSVDEQLEQTVLGAVARARELEAAGRCPPPLEDSPKCHGCSLSGICLPDEVRTLIEKPTWGEVFIGDVFDLGDDPWNLGVPTPDPAPPPDVRRLYPARDDKVPLYVQEQGAGLRLSGGRLVVTAPGHKAVEVRIANTSSVTLYGNVQVTSQALRTLMENGIPVLFASSGGWLIGRALGVDTKNVELRRAQYARSADEAWCLRLARSLVHAKIANSRTLLRRNHRESPEVALSELKQFARKAKESESIESLLGIEGTAARAYFRAFSGMLKADAGAEFQFDRRNRRPPTDPINALLSFCYSMLARETAVAAQAVGLEPLVGFYHQPHFGRPSLALDLMEEFRSVLADSTVITAINNGVVTVDDFVFSQGAVALKQPGRKRFIQAFERRLDQLVIHPIFDYRVSYRRVLEVQARLLSRVVLGELPDYPAFRIR